MKLAYSASTARSRALIRHAAAPLLMLAALAGTACGSDPSPAPAPDAAAPATGGAATDVATPVTPGLDGGTGEDTVPAAPDAGAAPEVEPASADGPTAEADVAPPTPDVPPPLPDVGPSTPAPDRAGTWSGATANDNPISFVIEAAGLKQYAFEWALAGCDGSIKTDFTPPRPLPGDSFTIPLNGGPGSVQGTLTGTFSGNTLSGSISIRAIPIPGVPSCSSQGQTTYTATRK